MGPAPRGELRRPRPLDLVCRPARLARSTSRLGATQTWVAMKPIRAAMMTAVICRFDRW